MSFPIFSQGICIRFLRGKSNCNLRTLLRVICNRVNFNITPPLGFFVGPDKCNVALKIGERKSSFVRISVTVTYVISDKVKF